MRETLEKLLLLQDRDQQLAQLRQQLEQLGPERESWRAKTARAIAARDAAKQRVMQIETERKRLELEVEAKKQLIEKYSFQQYQTRKNEEYRALAHEIEMCREAIRKLEDQELDLMEQAEAAEREVVAASRAAEEAQRAMTAELARLAEREQQLQAQLAELEAGREALAAAVDEAARLRYERLFRHKGGKVLVGVQHAVCGGCHMRLPPQLLISVQTLPELITCPNCGRILFYTPDMDLAPAE